jgi:hypothetical protein
MVCRLLVARCQLGYSFVWQEQMVKGAYLNDTDVNAIGGRAMPWVNMRVHRGPNARPRIEPLAMPLACLWPCLWHASGRASGRHRALM